MEPHVVELKRDLLRSCPRDERHNEQQLAIDRPWLHVKNMLHLFTNREIENKKLFGNRGDLQRLKELPPISDCLYNAILVSSYRRDSAANSGELEAHLQTLPMWRSHWWGFGVEVKVSGEGMDCVGS